MSGAVVNGAVAIAAETGKRLRAAQPLNAVLDWSQELLDAEAGRIDAMPGGGMLTGMPLVLKDNIVTREQPTTCGSQATYRRPACSSHEDSGGGTVSTVAMLLRTYRA